MNDFKNELRVENGKSKNNERRYYSEKGSVQRARDNKRKNGNKLKIKRTVAGVLAAISIGAVSGCIAKNYSKDEPNIIEIIEQYNAINQLGLSQENIDNLQKIENSKDINSEELYDLTLDIINNKMSNSLGWERNKTETHYRDEKGDGQTYMSVEYYGDKYSKMPTETYSSRNVKMFSKKGTLPKEIEKAIMILHEIDEIKFELENSRCSQNNSQKRLKKCVEKLNEFAAMGIVKDKDGILAVYSIDELVKNNKAKDISEQYER